MPVEQFQCQLNNLSANLNIHGASSNFESSHPYKTTEWPIFHSLLVVISSLLTLIRLQFTAVIFMNSWWWQFLRYVTYHMWMIFCMLVKITEMWWPSYKTCHQQKQFVTNSDIICVILSWNLHWEFRRLHSWFAHIEFLHHEVKFLLIKILYLDIIVLVEDFY